MTVHTGPDCDMPATRDMTGTPLVNNCDVFTDGNSGCGVHATTSNSYGPDFNANGGGWYVMERTNDFIRLFFWPRDSTSVPSDVTGGSSTICTDNWVSREHIASLAFSKMKQRIGHSRSAVPQHEQLRPGWPLCAK